MEKTKGLRFISTSLFRDQVTLQGILMYKDVNR